MVEDTLRGYVAPHWCEELDFSILTRMNAEYIGPELYNRIGDMLWRVEFREGSPLGGPPLDNGERPYLLVLFEFQSAVDPDMAWRMHEYVYLLQRHRRGNGTLKVEGREAPVLAVVVYNGDRVCGRRRMRVRGRWWRVRRGRGGRATGRGPTWCSTSGRWRRVAADLREAGSDFLEVGGFGSTCYRRTTG